MTRRRGAGALLVVAAGLVVSGCSQVDALAPVGGDTETKVRTAAIVVLLDAEIGIESAPTCRQVDDLVTCTGRTSDRRPVAVTSTGGSGDATLTVTVDGTVVFTGSLDEVIARAATAR